ncbi:MAG TPA: MFS transporter [Blastocatellia bacterium]
MVETEHQTKKEAGVGAYAWVVVALLWIVALLNYVDRQIISSVFPLLKADMGLSDTELGLLGSAFLWVYALLSPISGFLADRFGRVRIIIVSLLVWSLVTWLTRYARSFDELIATRALMGLSEACYIPAALALIADYHYKGRLSLASGIHTSGIYVGIILGGAGGGWMGERFGWRFAFAALGVFGVVYALILLLTLRGTETAKREEAAKPQFLPALRELLSLPGFKTLLLVFASFSLANWAIYTWLPNYLYERFNMKLAAAGFSATFYIQVASFGGILLGGWMADRWNQVSARGRVLTQCIGVALAAPCLFLVGFTASTAPLIAGLIVFGLGRGFYDCNTMPVLSQIARSDLRATGYGILNMAGTLTGGVIAVVAGALKTHIGLGGVFQIAALLLLISAVALSRLRVERDA